MSKRFRRLKQYEQARQEIKRLRWVAVGGFVLVVLAGIALTEMIGDVVERYLPYALLPFTALSGYAAYLNAELPKDERLITTVLRVRPWFVFGKSPLATFVPLALFNIVLFFI